MIKDGTDSFAIGRERLGTISIPLLSIFDKFTTVVGRLLLTWDYSMQCRALSFSHGYLIHSSTLPLPLSTTSAFYPIAVYCTFLLSCRHGISLLIASLAFPVVEWYCNIGK